MKPKEAQVDEHKAALARLLEDHMAQLLVCFERRLRSIYDNAAAAQASTSRLSSDLVSACLAKRAALEAMDAARVEQCAERQAQIEEELWASSAHSRLQSASQAKVRDAAAVVPCGILQAAATPGAVLQEPPLSPSGRNLADEALPLPPEVPDLPDQPSGPPPYMCGKVSVERIREAAIQKSQETERSSGMVKRGSLSSSGTAPPPEARQGQVRFGSNDSSALGAPTFALSRVSGTPASCVLAPPRRRPVERCSEIASVEGSEMVGRRSNLSTLSPVVSIATRHDMEGLRPDKLNIRNTMARFAGTALTKKVRGPSVYEGSETLSGTWRKGDKKERKVFEDVSQLKSQVHKALEVPVYNVMDFYSDSGVCQAIARSRTFDVSILWVIFLNTIWIAVDAEYNDADILLEAPAWFQVLEHCFCLIFALEWVIRLGAFESKFNALRDRAFVFDSFLVLMSVLETWVMTAILLMSAGVNGRQMSNTGILRLFKLIRICRMARVGRLLRAIPELMVLIKGLVSASRSVLLTMLLLCTVVFLFSVTFKQVTKDTALGDKYFKSLAASMFNLLVYATFPDFAQIVEDATAEHIIFGLLLFAYVFIAFFTVLNLLVGVIVQVVEVVSAVEHEEIMVKDVRRRLLRALEDLFPESHCGERTMISRSDFQTMICTATTARAIHELGVDVVGLLESEDFIFSDATQDGIVDTTDRIAFGSFMEAVLQLRGTNQATVKDIVNLRKCVLKTMSAQEAGLAQSIKRDIVQALGSLNLSRCSIQEEEA
mmetsp:Transcript_66606/g.192355  ORF Transcript_66606/g.192355 Transcript_66606/m.192355 type:complete len:773 (-) Transcript_66606:136-2454(-)